MRPHRWRSIGVAAAVLAALAACADQTADDAEATGENDAAAANESGAAGPNERQLENGERVVSYTVRGIVVSLPTSTLDLQVKHEPIPEFDAGPGKPPGMNAMTMGFPLADDIDIDGMAPGQKVRLAFEVTHRPDGALKHFELVRWSALPDDTELSVSLDG